LSAALIERHRAIPARSLDPVVFDLAGDTPLVGCDQPAVGDGGAARSARPQVTVRKKRNAEACVFIFGGCAPCAICSAWKSPGAVRSALARERVCSVALRGPAHGWQQRLNQLIRKLLKSLVGAGRSELLTPSLCSVAETRQFSVK
jgi:hypothetical protein